MQAQAPAVEQIVAPKQKTLSAAQQIACSSVSGSLGIFVG
jgi:hypothetical protein